METTSESIVEQGLATAGDNTTINSVDTNDWYAQRKSKGADEAHTILVKQEQGKVSTEEGEPTDDVSKPDDKAEISDVDKANHAWTKKYGKESGKRKQAEEMANHAKEQAEMYRQHAQQLEAKLKQYQDTQIDRTKYATEGDYMRDISRKEALEVQAYAQLDGMHQHAQQAQMEAERQSWAGKVEQATTVIKDWHEVVTGANNIPMSNEVLQDITQSDVGAELAYYLAKNPSEAIKLNNMDDRSRIRYMARLEMKVEGLYDNGRAQAIPQVTATPLKPTAPATRVSGGAPATANTISMSEYAQRRRQGHW